ncbi:MAG: gliding motility-associated C-terminal domain-containing protein [Bacteroidetes bacterium]|nr:gliding motility-associated C-terminal domain-containing protein [Bacteroidota bacterium]
MKPSETNNSTAVSDIYINASCNPDSATQHIAYSCYVPNTFTPNGDGVNDRFGPLVTGVDALEFKIYNASNTLIFSETNTVSSGWDGKTGGKIAPTGIYHYTLKTHEVCRQSDHYYNGICNLQH